MKQSERIGSKIFLGFGGRRRGDAGAVGGGRGGRGTYKAMLDYFTSYQWISEEKSERVRESENNRESEREGERERE